MRARIIRRMVNPPEGVSPTKQLADFVFKTNFDDLPSNVVDKAKELLLDYIGATLIGSREGTLSQIIFEYLSSIRGKEEATIIGSKLRVPCANAALANGIFGHALDLDDGHRYGTIHPGTGIIPAALAVAEMGHSSGKKLINAMVLGYDVTLRVASAINISHMMRGFHTTGTCCPFGAAVAASKLLKLDNEQLHNAIGIAGIQGAGLQEMLHSGQMIKPLQPGKAAQAGVLAAILAKKGALGPKTVLEGDKGFISAVTDACDYDVLLTGLGERFEILNTYVKPYPCCRHVHAPVDIILALKEEENLNYRDIKRILINSYIVAINETARIFTPKTPDEARFSMPFAVAAALVNGRLTLDEFSYEGINDKRIVNLISVIKIQRDRNLEENYPQTRGCKVDVTLNDGSVTSQKVDLPKGEPENPLTKEELNRKFLYYSKRVVGERTSKEIIELVDDLENISNLGHLIRLLNA